MKYLPTVNYDAADNWMIILFALGFSFVFLVAIITAMVASDGGLSELRRKQKRFLIGGWILAVAVLAVAFIPKASVDEGGHHNLNLAANLKQKYDIKSVDFDRNDYVSIADLVPNARHSAAQKIFIITNDEKSSIHTRTRYQY